jgi:large subunit ribosomal protein L6
MSRIGRLPVLIPQGVQVEIEGLNVKVKGPKGTLQRTFAPGVNVNMDQGNIIVTRASEEARIRALHGTTRALINNMVTGVHSGFTKILEIEGVGYRATMDGKTLVLNLGYSHPVRVEPQAGISFEVDEKTRQVKVNGSDIEQIGQVAADIRKIRPPEPYKGKGVHYLGEKIRRKAGKAGKGGKGGKK